MKVRSRYERGRSYWYNIVSSIRRLDSVALDESQEITKEGIRNIYK